MDIYRNGCCKQCCMKETVCLQCLCLNLPVQVKPLSIERDLMFTARMIAECGLRYCNPDDNNINIRRVFSVLCSRCN